MRVAGKEIQDPVQGLVRVRRMQGRQAQVTGIGIGDRCLHRMAIAHLADHDHTGRLAHGFAQCVFVR